MRLGRPKAAARRLPMLRHPNAGYEADKLFRAGADVSVRQRLDEFRSSFREHGARLVDLDDPVCAVSVGAALSAPFLSITDLRGTVRRLLFDAIAADRSPITLASLLSVSAATDGDLQALAGNAAATIGAKVPAPPWAESARNPGTKCRMELLRDRHDDEAEALVVTVGQARWPGAFFIRFYQRSLLTERIYFLPGVKRRALLAGVAAGSELTRPYQYVLRDEIAAAGWVDVVNSMVSENEVNLARGQGFPPYPPDLAHLTSIRDVTPVPALLVLLRKFVASASGFSEWPFSADHPTIWR